MHKSIVFFKFRHIDNDGFILKALDYFLKSGTFLVDSTQLEKAPFKKYMKKVSLVYFHLKGLFTNFK